MNVVDEFTAAGSVDFKCADVGGCPDRQLHQGDGDQGRQPDGLVASDLASVGRGPAQGSRPTR